MGIGIDKCGNSHAILQMVDDLEINHTFVHADEAISSKVRIIAWLHEEKHDKIVILKEGFGTILVTLIF